jgi:hypothetical protein
MLTRPARPEPSVAPVDTAEITNGGAVAGGVGTPATPGSTNGVAIADTPGIANGVAIAATPGFTNGGAVAATPGLGGSAGLADLYEVTAAGFRAGPSVADDDVHADASLAPPADPGGEPDGPNDRDSGAEAEDSGRPATTSGYHDRSASVMNGVANGHRMLNSPDPSISADVVRAADSPSEGSEAGIPESVARDPDPAIP